MPARTKRFSSQPLSRQSLLDLVDEARAAPTQFHLQPAHYWIVSDAELRRKLYGPCMKNHHILDAPAIVVFSASRFVASEHKEEMIVQELEAESLTVDEADALEAGIKMYFDTGPMGFGWLGKLIAVPFLRLFTAMPRLACIHKRLWLHSQVMRNATLFWRAAKEAKLGAEFIDMFDEWRIKAALSIPWHHVVVAVCAVGHIEESFAAQTQITIEETLH